MPVGNLTKGISQTVRRADRQWRKMGRRGRTRGGERERERGCIGIEPDGFSSVQVRSNEAIQTVTTDRFKVLRNAAAHGTASTLPAGNISHTDATTRLYLANYAPDVRLHTLETLARSSALVPPIQI